MNLQSQTLEASPRTVRPFDVEAVRADFPILATEAYGQPLVYLDNAASAQKPRVVIGKITEVMETGYANVHRGLHYLSNAATAAYEEARRTARRFLNAAHEDEIIFTSGATDSLNLVADSFGAGLTEGDEIILSVMEHHSNIVPWHYLRERKGVVLKWLDMTDEGVLKIEDLDALISARTKLVALTHMSNALGTITPAAEVIRIAHAKGVPVLLDGAQGAVHVPVDVQALDVDFYAATGHKLYGPTGIGLLYAKRDHLNRMRPYRGGGEMIGEVTRDKVTYAAPPQRFEAGTPPIVEAIALATALDYLSQFDREDLIAYEHDLMTYGMERLREMNDIAVYGTAPDKGSILSFNIEGAHPHDVATIIDRAGVAVRAGHHCAQPLMDRLGVTATARASFAFYNTREEVDRLCDALVKAKAMLR